MRDSRGVNLKLLLSNEDGTSMVLMGTSVWDAGEEEACLTSRWVCSIAKGSSYMESEVSLQLQRFFSDCMNLFEGIRMRSVVVSCCDEEVKEPFEEAVMDLERSWRSGTAFRL